MKKLLIALMLIGVTAEVSYGALSEDMSVYVRKDVFEVYMQNINTNMEKILEELKAQRKDMSELTRTVSVLSARIDGVDAKISGLEATLTARIDGSTLALSNRIDGVNTRVDDLRNGLYLWLVVIGTIISWPKIREKLQSRDKPESTAKPLTLEDVQSLVKRLIDENNAELKKQLQRG